MHRWLRRLTALLAVAALAAFAGCGGDDDEGSTGTGGATAPATAPATTGGETDAGATDTGEAGGGAAAEGAQVFADAGCGNCHTLAAADASGKVGPNLDDVKPSADHVREMVTNGGGGMPSFEGQLSPEEIDAVADYVSSAAGGG